MATIEGQIKKVFQDERDWYHIQTDHPTVSDLRTKQVAKAREAKQWEASGEALLIEYKHQQRPKDDGSGHWDNYYFEGARTIAAPSSNGSAEIERVTSSARKTDPGDAWRIALSVGVKAVMDERAYLEGSTFTELAHRALAWATFVYTTPPPSEETSGVFPSPASEFDEPGGVDDDIPF